MDRPAPALAFSSDELRQWLRSDVEASAIVPHLAGPTACVGALVGEVVDLLAWRRLVDCGFFARLRDARPQRAAELDRVAALWEGEPRPRQHHPAPPRRSR